MAANNALGGPEEFTQRAKEIYERDVAPHLRPEDANKFVANDIQSGGFEINNDDYAATTQLLKRHPRAQIWLSRVGQRTAYRIGKRLTPGCLQ